MNKTERQKSVVEQGDWGRLGETAGLGICPQEDLHLEGRGQTPESRSLSLEFEKVRIPEKT